MAQNDYLGAFVEGLCGDKKKGTKKPQKGGKVPAPAPAPAPASGKATANKAAPATDTEKPQCRGDSTPLADTSVLGQPSCQVKNLQNLFRENKNIRQKFFRRTVRKALGKMSLNALQKSKICNFF